MPNYIIALLAWVCNRIPKIRSDFLWQKRSCPRLHGTNKTKDGKRWHTVTICPKHFTATMSKTMSKTRPRHPRRGPISLFRFFQQICQPCIFFDRLLVCFPVFFLSGFYYPLVNDVQFLHNQFFFHAFPFLPLQAARPPSGAGSLCSYLVGFRSMNFSTNSKHLSKLGLLYIESRPPGTNSNSTEQFQRKMSLTSIICKNSPFLVSHALIVRLLMQG